MMEGSCRPLTIRLVVLRLSPVSAASVARATPDCVSAYFNAELAHCFTTRLYAAVHAPVKAIRVILPRNYLPSPAWTGPTW